MASSNDIVNIVIAGLGGQGVVKASDILSDAAFRAGFDVKKSEIHGMSQRGGSVSSDVRFGTEVQSPMVPWGCADYLLLTDTTQWPANAHRLRKHGTRFGPEHVPHVSECAEGENAIKRKTLNVALLGVLSAQLPIPVEHWLSALRDHVPAKHLELNVRVFFTSRTVEQILHAHNGFVTNVRGNS